MKKNSVFKWYFYVAAILTLMLLYSCTTDSVSPDNIISFREEYSITVEIGGTIQWCRNSYQFEECYYNGNTNCSLTRTCNGGSPSNSKTTITGKEVDSYNSTTKGIYVASWSVDKGIINYYRLYRNNVLIVDKVNVKHAGYTEELKFN